MPDAQPVTTETTATASLRHLFARGGPFTTVVMRAEAQK